MYTNGVLPYNGAGVIHIVNTSENGRAIIEYYADDDNHYHAETSKLSSYEHKWYKDVRDTGKLIPRNFVATNISANSSKTFDFTDEGNGVLYELSATIGTNAIKYLLSHYTNGLSIAPLQTDERVTLTVDSTKQKLTIATTAYLLLGINVIGGV